MRFPPGSLNRKITYLEWHPPGVKRRPRRARTLVLLGVLALFFLTSILFAFITWRSKTRGTSGLAPPSSVLDKRKEEPSIEGRIPEAHEAPIAGRPGEAEGGD